MRNLSLQKMQKSLNERKPKSGQEQIFFNSLKGQFKGKDAFLRFNQIKKHKTEKITQAHLRPVEANIDIERRIS